MKSLRFIGGLIAVANGEHKVDCSSYPYWIPQVYSGSPAVMVVHNNHLWRQKYWASEKDAPQSSSSSPWGDQGFCDILPDDETDGDGTEDCSSADIYNPNQSYATTGTKVVSEKNLYVLNWYANAGDAPGKSDAWAFKGKCIDGTIPSGDKGPPVDCSGAFPWEAKAYTAEWNYPVHHKGKQYYLKYYAEPTDEPVTPVPSDVFPWGYRGDCIDGTAGDGPDIGINTRVDCSNIAPWIGRKIYQPERTQNVSFSGKVYLNKYYTQAVPPNEADPKNGDHPWEQVAKCEDGTEQPTPDTDLPENIAQLLCSCCKGCADIQTMNPVCMDDTAAGKCYFTDCSKIGGYDEAKCEEVKKGGYLSNYEGTIEEATGPWPSRLYMPYVDSGLYPFVKLSEVASQTGVKHFVLAFLTAANGQTISGCQAGFAGVIPVTAGPTAWNTTTMSNDYLYDEVNKLRAMGGDISVSFGGAMGTELADSQECHKGDPVQNLVDAYSAAIDFLKLREIDFDIEGGAIAKANRETGWTYRFAAVKKLLAKYPGLRVGWTLPALPTGLTDDGVLFLNDLFGADIPLFRMNIMTMDYGEATVCPGDEMARCERDAIDNLAQQVFDAINAQGKAASLNVKTLSDVYPLIGSTPMLGMNDVTIEMYTVADARQNLKHWLTEKPIGFISNWSLHRDRPCNPPLKYVDTKCSGATDQTEAYEFAKLFGTYTKQ